MRDLLDQIGIWFGNGRSVALATVIKTWGSSPRPVGSLMVITDQMEISGSVSGGCVEGAVIDAAQLVLADGKPQRLHFGVANEEAWEVGLSCGGEIEIFLRLITPDDLDLMRKAVERNEPFWMILVIEGGPNQAGSVTYLNNGGTSLLFQSRPDLDPVLKKAALAAAIEGKTTLTNIESEQIQEVFFQLITPPRQLVLVGGVHIAIPLATLADTLDFQVIVVDPRRLFGTTERFPEVNHLIQEWPQQAFQKIQLTDTTAVVMLTHDPKIDDPAIKIALDSPAFYIGALGSRKTHQKRLDRLTAQGVKEGALDQIHGPVGLDLGASSPEEIALAIMAEIIKVWYQGS